jgi:hypothetical protein
MEERRRARSLGIGVARRAGLPGDADGHLQTEEKADSIWPRHNSPANQWFCHASLGNYWLNR